MRKIKVLTVTFLCALMVFLACACGSSKSTQASDKAVSIAQQAIDITDQYLDGKASYSTVSDTLESLHNDMDYVDDMSSDTSDESAQKTADSIIRSKLVIIKGDIIDDYYNGDNETYDEIVDDRNELAEKAGLETR